jgi:hypothetical protein
MKKLTHYLVQILVITIVGACFFSCTDNKKKISSPEQPEQPQCREARINWYNEIYNERYMITVQGTFTEAQWNRIPRRIEDSLRTIGKLGISEMALLIVAFAHNDFVFIVEETSEYSAYKIADNAKLCLNINIFENGIASNTRNALKEMVRKDVLTK